MACSCGCCCKYLVLTIVYFRLIYEATVRGIWRWANEWDVTCQHSPLPVNQSGIKIMLAGWAKSGTWTMSHALTELGYNAYHSQQFNLHVWSPLADEHWMRVTNGSRRSINAGVWPTFFGEIRSSDDYDVLAHLKPEALARQISKCRVDAIACDGIERAHEPILDVSPGIKVIMLDWREWEGWKKSMDNQNKSMAIILLFMELFYAALHFLPWGLLVKAIDPLIGNDINKLLTSGAPPFTETCTLGVMLWQPFVKNRQIFSHWAMGLGMTAEASENEETFKSLFTRIKQRVPAENVMHWNFKNKGWEDLCAFLEVKDCPYAGKVKTEPNFYTDTLRNGIGRGWKGNCDEPFALIPLYLVLHWINFKLLTAVVSCVLVVPRYLLRLGGREKQD